MVEHIALVVLIFVIVFQGWQAIEERKAVDIREKDLLNRIMAGNYAHYVQGEELQRQHDSPFPVDLPEKGIPI
jgi:hypothetical protein